MPAKVIIMDGAKGTGQYAGVTPIGELLLAGYGNLNNRTSFQTLTTNTANFFGPIVGQQFVITSLTMDGNNTDVVIFEAPTISSATVDKVLWTMHLRATTNLFVPLSFGGFLPVSQGEYVNATNSAGTTNITIAGYYIPIIHNEE